MAPASWRSFLERALPEAGIRAVVRDRLRPGKGGDPYRLAATAREVGDQAAGILLIAPPSRSPANLVPGAVVGGLPVGLLPVATPGAMRLWLEACRSIAARGKRRRSWAILAEWEDHYLRLARRFARQLQGLPSRHILHWPANRLNRADLLDGLRCGPVTLSYFGHGQPEGLVGYHGFWREHLHALAGSPAMGTWLSFSCGTLAMPVHGLPWGVELVRLGRAGAYLGSIDSVSTTENSRLARLLAETVGCRRPRTIGHCLQLVDQSIQQNSSCSTLACWSTYRLIGNPLQRL